MGSLIQRFLSFDRLMGVALVRVIYYFGLALICGGIVIGVMLGVMTLVADLGRGVVQMIAIPAVGAVVLMLWRFVCEVFVVVFEMNNHLHDLRDAVYGAPPASPPDPNAPHF